MVIIGRIVCLSYRVLTDEAPPDQVLPSSHSEPCSKKTQFYSAPEYQQEDWPWFQTVAIQYHKIMNPTGASLRGPLRMSKRTPRLELDPEGLYECLD